MAEQRQTAGARVAFVLTPVDFGGAERVSLSFLRQRHRLAAHITPILLCRPWERDNVFLSALQEADISFIEVPTRLRPRQEGRDPFRVLRSASMVYREVRAGGFDLLHCNGYFADLIGLAAAKRLGLPIVSTCHGFISNTRRYRLYNTLDVTAMRFMNRIIAVSEKIRGELAARGVAQERIEVVQNAVQPAPDLALLDDQRRRQRRRYGLGAEELVLGYVGRLSEEKGLRHLLEATARLSSCGLPVRTLVIGEGPQLPRMQQLATELGLAERVIFAGFQAKVEALLPALDIFILPSLTEGTSMALLEAMACGLATVATAVGGTPRVVEHARNGLLVKAGSAEEIAAAVKKLADQASLRQALGTAARKTVGEKFGLDQWLQRMDAIYEDTVGGRR